MAFELGPEFEPWKPLVSELAASGIAFDPEAEAAMAVLDAVASTWLEGELIPSASDVQSRLLTNSPMQPKQTIKTPRTTIRRLLPRLVRNIKEA